MDSSAPAAVPWLVLGGALLALAGLATVWLTGRRDRPPAAPASAAPPPVPAPPPAPRFADDDLPGFLDAPPGTPAPEPPARAGDAADREEPAAAEDPATTRALLAMASAALLLVAVLAGVAGGVRDADEAAAPPSASPAPPSPPVEPSAPAPQVPQLPGVPTDPLPGEGGAGTLANRSVPLGTDGVAARLAFGGIVVERHAVGVAVGYPALSLTAQSASPGGAALAHLRLPTWNCLDGPPARDPADAGCVPSLTEYADLPAPALTLTRDGDDLRLTGRFPTYTRPVGTAPVYTGRVYDLTVTVSPSGAVRDGRATAEATLFLGTDRVGTLDAPGLNEVRYAG
ncbi:hypothetical protein GCU56_05045 [Geodermatophilus sabuli]|uniref:Uncharacterized protein n=1 Tax=Geodermatophilus sabuli TaxID=1564158 RepID=A0A7K3VXW0_9ACTN|nr:hypothetical protein [Geodermatophilus sabuli]NEK57240.1 hypothetical protein [Geodermatophilus sabuli]